MKTKFKGREVEIEAIWFASDVVDSYIQSAYFVDTEKFLNEDELDQLAEEASEVLELAHYEHQIDRADARADALRDE